MDRDFGLYLNDNGDLETYILSVFKDIEKNTPNIHKLNPIDRYLAMIESYNIVLGIVDEKDANPLAMHCESDVTGLHELSGYDLRIDQYMKLRIGENFKISLPEFLELPRNMINKLIWFAETMEAATAKAAKEADNEMRKQLEATQQTHRPAFSHRMTSLLP